MTISTRSTVSAMSVSLPPHPDALPRLRGEGTGSRGRDTLAADMPLPYERLAWIVGVLGCAGFAWPLVGRVPLDETDRAFGETVAAIQHEVRAQYVTDVDDARLKLMQKAATDGMLSVLDPYTIYVPPSNVEQFNTLINGTFVGIGVVIRPDEAGEIEVRTPIEGGPAYEAGVESGDVFAAVNGERVRGLDPDQLKSRLVGTPGTSVGVTFRRYDGTEKTIDIERRAIVTPTVTGYQRNADGTWDWFLNKPAGIAYLYISQFNEQTSHDVAAALKEIDAQGARGLVLDLRFNGGGRVEEATRIADLFLDEGVIVRVRGRVRPETVATATPGDTLFRQPLAILVNGYSASASEILAGALSDHRRAVVVGTRTYGKGSVQEVEDWKDDGALKITVARYFLPSGRSVQKVEGNPVWGVDPNVEVKLADDELAANERALTDPGVIPPKSHATTRPERVKDRQMDAAVEALASMLARSPTTTAAK